MNAIQVFTSYSHEYSTGANASKDIHYYENRWVQAPNGIMVCIDTANPTKDKKIGSYIGLCIEPELPINMWSGKDYERRRKFDFDSLHMKRQLIHHCNGTVSTFSAQAAEIVDKF